MYEGYGKVLEAWTLKRILWSLRKARLPISSTDLVLDVGSGSNPHPAADVLLEKYVDQTHRYEPLVADRPSVLGDACKMPFRDKTFDFVIAFHVLEHVADPARFMDELQRVGKAGYIEVPNALFERLVPYDVHLSEIMEIDNTLIVRKKEAAQPDYFLNGLNLIAKSRKWRKFFYGNPELFHVRYLWKDTIRYRILNPETTSDWFVEPQANVAGDIAATISVKDLRSFILAMYRRWYRLKKRRGVDVLDLIVCPECHGRVVKQTDAVYCVKCGMSYPRTPMLDFNRGARCPMLVGPNIVTPKELDERGRPEG